MSMRSIIRMAAGVLAVGSITLGPAAAGQEDAERVRLAQELQWTEDVFREATPGSPAQFRARESADALRLKLQR
jgi:hypothetical protein